MIISLKDVVLDNFFDEAGVEQLAVDVRRGIVPVFRPVLASSSQKSRRKRA